ncbi:MAG: hypothetical protein A2Z03_07650 [Chloroflexi bacterium RBG_16_56_8]|nr:MAG: hypothetical protein A2Z03_07650 [Chloroflexi bacterium RBG_16_56_8]
MRLGRRFHKTLHLCSCNSDEISKAHLRPLLDQIDMRIEAPRVDYGKLSSDRMGETSEVIRERVEAARQRQRQRFSNHREPATRTSNVICNADMHVGEIRKHCKLDDQGQSLMRSAMTQLQLSARAYHRILKLARTIADLAGSETIQASHLAEALQYRPRVMMG